MINTSIGLIGVAKQSAKATAATEPAFVHGLTGGQVFKLDRTVESDDVSCGVRAGTDSHVESVVPGADFDTYGYADALPLYYYAAMGSIASAAASGTGMTGYYEHTITLGDVLDLFSTTAAQVCDGQQYDMDFEHVKAVTMREYLKMIGLKTAVLIACSAKMGALIAHAPAEIADGLYNYGYNLGLAFQVADDYLDAYGDEKVFGKPIGGDIVNGKKSWLTVRAMEKGAKGIAEALEADLSPAEKIATVMDLYDSVHVAEDARETVARFHEKALAAAEKVTGIAGYTVLKRFADDLVDRVK